MNFKEIAIKKAKQSTCRYKISAIGINKRGEVVGSAFNKPRFVRYGGGLHAEMNLIKKYGGKIKTIILCRINKSGDILGIRPCKNCMKIIDKLGMNVTTIDVRKYEGEGI